MRSKILIALAALVLSASAASAQPGCRRPRDGLASRSATRGPNANAPSKAIYNPCSSMYDFGRNVRRMEKRRYPNAVVRH